MLDSTGTLIVEMGFELTYQAGGILVMQDIAHGEPIGKGAVQRATTDQADPVLLEIMSNLYMSIAEQMGHVLRRTALSTNIRERLDFSCAVFEAHGGLVANAPHIPVHLGAMGESVRSILATHKEIREGDVFATNDPEHGGSHLPDVTVASPVHDHEGQLLFFVASRGHHADIGVHPRANASKMERFRSLTRAT